MIEDLVYAGMWIVFVVVFGLAAMFAWMAGNAYYWLGKRYDDYVSLFIGVGLCVVSIILMVGIVVVIGYVVWRWFM